jgi:hypothetical protein
MREHSCFGKGAATFDGRAKSRLDNGLTTKWPFLDAGFGRFL